MNTYLTQTVKHFRALNPQYIAGALLTIFVLAGCGGGSSPSSSTVTTTLTNTVNALSVLNGPTISGGSSCTSTLTLNNPNAESYSFTYQFDGLDISGHQIATIVFSNTILGNNQQSFLSSWQPMFAQNASTACTSIHSATLKSSSSSPVTTTAIRMVSTDTAAAFAGVWSTLDTISAWGVSIDDHGAVFGQNDAGCVLQGLIGGATGVEGIRRVTLERGLCGNGDESFEGVVLIDPERPAELHLWSQDADGGQFNLTAMR